MAKFLKKLIVLFFLLSACYSYPENPSFNQTAPSTPAQTNIHANSVSNLHPSFLEIPWHDPEIFKLGLIKSQAEKYSEIPGSTIYHIALEISDNLVTIDGHEQVLYTNRENTSLSRVEFRLFPNILNGKMTIGSLMVDGNRVVPVYDLENSLLIVPVNLLPDERISIEMGFIVSVPTSTDSNYGVLASLKNVLTLAHAYPMIPVYDDSGWHTEIPAPWGDLTFTDAAFFVVQITAPQDLMLIASGRQVSTKNSGGKNISIFALGPARDFIIIAVKGYKVQSLQVGETTVNSYAPVEFQKRAALAEDTAAEALHIFNKRFTPYPYTEFDIVATQTLALGVEYPGLVVITNRIYGPGDTFNNTSMDNYIESTVAHETGHQWFYNLVGNDQINHPWLDESLTQFITWQYYADRYGIDQAAGFKQSLESRWQRIKKEQIPVDLPVASFTSAQYGAIVYGRGALFFFALSDAIHQNNFDNFLTTYTQKFSWEIASTGSIKSIAEQSCACDLTDIFKEWVTP